MNTTDILTRVYDAMTPFDAISKASDSRDYNAESIAREMHAALSILADDLSAQIRLECASSRGNLNAAKTVSRMLNAVKKSNRPALAYAWDDKQGRQCICDGYRAYRLSEHLPLEPRPADAGEPIDLDKVFGANPVNRSAKVALPSVAELKASIAVQRAQVSAAAKRRGFVPMWDFGERMPTVNADYLLDMLAVLGDAAEAFLACTDKGFGVFCTVYFTSERGDGILLPIRTTAKSEEYTRAKDAAEAAAQERREHPEIVERRERHARRLKERLEEYAARVKDDPTYALSPDEFADMARYADANAA